MSFLTELIANFGSLAVEVISFFGYFGVCFLMILESMIFPVPSELVMPFVGFLIAKNEMSFCFVILFSSLGSLIGSLLSYYLGKYGGEKTVLKFGKYLLLDQTDLEKTEKWFGKKGEITILIGRFIPIVRHLISIPAGIGKMNFKKFLLYTAIGATIWNTFLAYLGFQLGKNWKIVEKYSGFFTNLTLVLLIIFGGYFIYRHVKNKRNNK